METFFFNDLLYKKTPWITFAVTHTQTHFHA